MAKWSQMYSIGLPILPIARFGRADASRTKSPAGRVYDDIPVAYTELANCPDWLSLTVIINDEQFRLDRGEILADDRRLDLRHGVLSRWRSLSERESIRWRSPSGNTVDLKFERFASLADEQVLALRCEITPITSGRLANDFDGNIEVRSSINRYPENQGFDHWEHLDRGKTEQGVWLQVRTRSTQIELGMAAKMTAITAETKSQVINTPDCPTLTITFVATVGQSVTVEKLVTVFTSRETKSPVQAAQTKLAQLPSYNILLTAHGVWQYWQATGDDGWMRDRGVEIILDTALFWLSRVKWHEKQQRYELCGVIGADEYHEDVRNNAYTNRLVQWHLEKAVQVYEWLQQTFPARATELSQQLSLTPVQILAFHSTISQMYIPYNPQLTDTAEYHYLTWQRLADEEKLPFDRQANEALRGVSRRESLMHIVGNKHYSEVALQAMMASKNRYYVESIDTITPQDLFPGAVELLTELRQVGIKIAIAKRCLEQVGSASKNARTVIEKLGIGNLVDAIADGDSVDAPKPAPDVFLSAAKQLGLDPSHCVVVEDATVGIQAAIAAGMRSILVSRGFANGIGPTTRVGAADIVLPNLIGVHAIDLQTQLKLVPSKPIEPTVQVGAMS